MVVHQCSVIYVKNVGRGGNAKLQAGDVVIVIAQCHPRRHSIMLLDVRTCALV